MSFLLFLCSYFLKKWRETIFCWTFEQKEHRKMSSFAHFKIKREKKKAKKKRIKEKKDFRFLNFLYIFQERAFSLSFLFVSFSLNFQCHACNTRQLLYVYKVHKEYRLGYVPLKTTVVILFLLSKKIYLGQKWSKNVWSDTAIASYKVQ